MATAKIKAHIKSKMQWDGMPEVLVFPPRTFSTQHLVDKDEIRAWVHDWNEFGRRVRRDILVLEKLLVDKCGVDPADFYGDPGDPPPDPDI